MNRNVCFAVYINDEILEIAINNRCSKSGDVFNRYCMIVAQKQGTRKLYAIE